MQCVGRTRFQQLATGTTNTQHWFTARQLLQEVARRRWHVSLTAAARPSSCRRRERAGRSRTNRASRRLTVKSASGAPNPELPKRSLAKTTALGPSARGASRAMPDPASCDVAGQLSATAVRQQLGLNRRRTVAPAAPPSPPRCIRIAFGRRDGLAGAARGGGACGEEGATESVIRTLNLSRFAQILITLLPPKMSRDENVPKSEAQIGHINN
jgi:hypothetical protein